MRISNQERRKIAAQLRESRDYASCLPKLPLAQNAIDVFERVLECVHYESGNVFDHLADLIDRPTCCNVYDEIYDEYEGGRCENGFKCSKCGEIVEDCEGYRVTGTFNYCPKCGREVVSE